MGVVIKPIVTEKMTDLSEKLNRYAFVVEKNANKIQIKEDVEKLYDVTVEAVNTMVYAGKVKSRSTKAGIIAGKTKAIKKAIVTVKDGDQIDFYSNI